MTEEELKELDAIEAAATPGPWAWESCGEKCYSYCLGVACDVDSNLLSGDITGRDAVIVDFVCESSQQSGRSDFIFITRARSAVPQLLAEVRRLNARNAVLEAELLKTIETMTDVAKELLK